MLHNKVVDNLGLVEFFRSECGRKSEASCKDYRKAVLALEGFCDPSAADFVDPSVSTVADFCVALRYNGLSYKTVLHYVDVLSALHAAAVQQSLVAPTDAYRLVKAGVKAVGSSWDGGLTVEDLDKLLVMMRGSAHMAPDAALFVDLMQLSMYAGGDSPVKLAMLKRDEVVEANAGDVLARYADVRRKYALPLNQSALTPRQLEKAVVDGISNQLRLRQLPVCGNAVEAIRGYWLLAALKCGVRASVAVAALGGRVPNCVRFASVAEPADISPDVRAEVIAQVRQMAVSNPRRWYAMRLRRRVDMAEVTRRIDEIEMSAPRPQLFYPTRQVARRLGKKMVFENEPLIREVAFFKCRVTDIAPLFKQIGDLAWCYRSGRGEYAAIHPKAMEMFQSAAGMFTPDYEVGPIGSIHPEPGDTIKVIDGLFAGAQGEVLKVEELAGEGVIYRMRIVDDHGIEWKVKVDPRMVSKD